MSKKILLLELPEGADIEAVHRYLEELMNGSNDEPIAPVEPIAYKPWEAIAVYFNKVLDLIEQQAKTTRGNMQHMLRDREDWDDALEIIQEDMQLLIAKLFQLHDGKDPDFPPLRAQNIQESAVNSEGKFIPHEGLTISGDWLHYLIETTNDRKTDPI